MVLFFGIGISGLGVCLLPLAANAAEVPPPVIAGKNGALEYQADAAGNRMSDFSHAGYGGGGVTLPEVPARVVVKPTEGDDGARIQAALDHVGRLAPDVAGLRGAVQLTAGYYEIAGQLKIAASGVVLRGAGAGEDGSVLLASGTDRRTLIVLGGPSSEPLLCEPLAISDEMVPVGSMRLQLANAGQLEVGSRIVIERPSPAEWQQFIGMDSSPARLGYQWKPGAHNLRWERVVTAVDGQSISIDAPLTCALERRFGGGSVRGIQQEGQLSNCGVEQLRCVSYFDPANPLDEQHAWNAVGLGSVRDAWVRDLAAIHFAGSAVQAGDGASRVTIQDCASLAPVSEDGGYRRMTFHSGGQQVLFLRCQSEQGRNDFTAGYHAAGPNVFLDCEARQSGGFSGSMGSWVTGLLFDGVKIDGGSLRLDNLETFNQGVGWAAANSMLWQCTASAIVCRTPPGATNWAIGSWGQLNGDGRWSTSHQSLRPASLYRAQLAERLGGKALAVLEPRVLVPPTLDLPEVATPSVAEALTGLPLTLVDGVFKIGDKRLSGSNLETAWWRGRLEPGRAAEIGPALTRFVPGRRGTGLTDALDEVAETMLRKGQIVFRHHPGLWYDRRRDDHQMTRRLDGEVWPPFFEQPFARSGQGKAWDGLSRYDLTRYSPWFFGRLHEFARIARAKGVVLVNEMYFQHNIIESGAHWVDSPWRPVNNINGTGFTEPPPFKGDTIKMADEFYDVSHPVRRELHRAYIRHHLDVLGEESNVIHTLTAENGGPLAFMQFWLDVVAEWERETGQHPWIALSAPKDVQDAILADPQRSAVVDVIDLSYWFRTANGQEFAPPGGRSLAPRQELRVWKGGRSSAASISDMAREYRQKYPDKAVITGLPEASDVQPP